MKGTRGGREVFWIGALVGLLGGVIVGSVAMLGVGDKIVPLLRALYRRWFGDGERIRFDLLGQ